MMKLCATELGLKIAMELLDRIASSSTARLSRWTRGPGRIGCWRRAGRRCTRDQPDPAQHHRRARAEPARGIALDRSAWPRASDEIDQT